MIASLSVYKFALFVMVFLGTLTNLMIHLIDGMVDQQTDGLIDLIDGLAD